MKIWAALLLIEFLSITTYAAVRRDAVIVNTTTNTAVILYIDGTTDAVIKPASERQIVFPPPREQLPIEINGVHREYICPIPPVEFQKIGLFYNRFKIALCEDQGLYLIPFDTKVENAEPVARRTIQPKGWPLRPVETK